MTTRDVLFRDTRYSLRTARQAPGLFLVAILTLGLGIGGATAMFSFVSGVLLAPLPYESPETLVALTRNNLQHGFGGMLHPPREVVLFQEQAESFSSLSGYALGGVTLTGAEAPESVREARVLPGLLSLLGVTPSIGRSFELEEHESQAAVVILGQGLWQRRFGGRAEAIGETLRLDGVEHRVVGVLPPGGDVPPMTFDILRPMAEAELKEARDLGVSVVARLDDGVSVSAAREEVNEILRRWEEENRPPATATGWRTDVELLRDDLLGDAEGPLWILFGAVLMVLGVACANVTNLLLARGAGRERELAIRAALGAGRGRIRRQLLVESVLVALAGGTLGVVLAFVGTRLLVALAPFDVPRLATVSVDGRVLVFSLLVSVGTGLAAGLIPSFLLSRQNLDRSLKTGGQVVGAGRHRQWLRVGVAAAQVALALTLAVGAGLMMRSFHRLTSVDPGFETGGVLTFQLSLPRYRVSEPGRWDAITEGLLERLSAIPTVSAAAASSWTPLSGTWGRARMSVEATSGEVTEREQWPMVLAVSPGYFRALGLPLLRGRELELEDGDGDAQGESEVVLVNRQLAEQAWPDEDPLGKRLKFGTSSSTSPWLTVVGVVEDARLVGLALEQQDGMFRPLLRTGRHMSVLQFLLRTRGIPDPEQLMPRVREAVRSVDEELPVSEVRTMEHLVSTNVSRSRFQLLVIAIFAAFALILAAIGIYGVLAHSVTQRWKEIGLRMALGAERGRVLRLVLRQGLSLVAAGMLVGLFLAFALTRLLRSLLYEVSVTDPWAFAIAASILGWTGLLATLGPAWRATRVDPATTLRIEPT